MDSTKHTKQQQEELKKFYEESLKAIDLLKPEWSLEAYLREKSLEEDPYHEPFYDFRKYADIQLSLANQAIRVDEQRGLVSDANEVELQMNVFFSGASKARRQISGLLSYAQDALDNKLDQFAFITIRGTGPWYTRISPIYGRIRK